MGDAELGVELRRGEARAHAAEHQPVDHRGVDVALDDDPLAGMGQRQADRVVALRGAVDQEPGAPRAPGLGRQALRLFEGRRLGADVDALGDRRDVVLQAGLADQLAQRRVGAGAALVAGDLEAARVAGRVGEQRVDVGRRSLTSIGHVPSLRGVFRTNGGHKAPRGGWAPLRGHLAGMKHTPHGYWLEEAGTVEPAPPLAGERDADVVVVGGGYTGMWAAWHLKQLEPEARVVLLEAAERCGQGPSGRNGGFCNVMWLSLPSMRERWGAEGALAVAPRRGRRGRRDRATSARRRRSTPGSGVPATSRSRPRPPTTRARPRRSPPAASWARPTRWSSCRAEEVAERCASPVFRGGVLFPDAATVQPARLALGLRERLQRRAGSRSASPRPLRSLRRRSDHVEARTEGGRRAGGARGAGDRRRRQGAPRPAARAGSRSPPRTSS